MHTRYRTLYNSQEDSCRLLPELDSCGLLAELRVSTCDVYAPCDYRP